MAIGEEHVDPPLDVDARRLGICRVLIGERQIIARYLRQSRWNDASWSMLLELYAADAVGKPLAVSSLGYASGVSIPTATRLTIDLEHRDFVYRDRDPHDARRMHVLLAPRGRAVMRCILDDCARHRSVTPGLDF